MKGSKMATKKTHAPVHNVKLRITLNGCDSSRTIVVPGNAPLLILHEMIQFVFGWLDYHLHEFKKGDVRYQLPDEEADYPFGKPKDETKFSISHLIAKKGDTFTYTYDFGDNWKHEILAEDVNAAEEPYTCTEVHGINGVEDSMYFAGPSSHCASSCAMPINGVEDSMYFAGPPGVKEILLNKRNKQYKECVGWLKEAFGFIPEDVLEIPTKEVLTYGMKDIGSEYIKFGLERFLR
jgi:hypothetical protein